MVGTAPTLTRLAGVRVGHAQPSTGLTGVTVVRFARPVPCVVDVRGGAAATYDTASLSLDSTFGRRWALFLSGGSLFGLDAASGIRTRILEEGEGHRAFRHPQRIAPISGAALFDLGHPSTSLPDYRDLGYAAATVASTMPVAHGLIGAGLGATVGKYLGRSYASPGGLGSAAIRVPGLGWTGAIVVVNSVGAIRDPASGRWVAGARRAGGAVLPPGLRRSAATRGGNLATATNLAVIVTETALSRPELQRVAILAQSGYARCVVPVNTATDGDVVFAASVAATVPKAERRPGERADRVGMAAADLIVAAALAAVGH